MRRSAARSRCAISVAPTGRTSRWSDFRWPRLSNTPHGQGILHRDIKPANLLLDGHGTTWVADFGLAKGIEQEAVSRTGEVLGTLLYMAPEQWRGTADARSDIYSLGVTLYELLTLRTPCQIQDRMKSLGPSGLHPAIVPPRKLSPSIPVDLETIVMRAIAEEPEHRYQTAGQLAADLGRFLEDRPISIRRPTLRERWSRWRRRNPAAAALSVLAACLAILVGVVLSIAYVQTRAGLAASRTNVDGPRKRWPRPCKRSKTSFDISSPNNWDKPTR